MSDYQEGDSQSCSCNFLQDISLDLKELISLMLEFGKKIHETTGLVAQNFYWTGTFFTRPKSYEKKKTKTQQKRILQ